MKISRSLRCTAIVMVVGIAVGLIGIHVTHIYNPEFNPADYDPCWSPPQTVVVGNLLGPPALFANLFCFALIVWGLHLHRGEVEHSMARLLRTWLFFVSVGGSAAALQLHYVITHHLPSFPAGAL